jgi:DNA-binding transcriptional ArsR family regulator
VVEVLRGGERAVNDIVARVGIHQSGVSRHLRILHEAGFVQVRPEGQQRYYSLRPERFREIEAWLKSLWEARLDRFEKALTRKARK